MARDPLPPNIAPWLSVADVPAAVAFYAAAFGAVELHRDPVVAHLAVGAADFWVQDDAVGAPDPAAGGAPVRMILTVDDPDATWAAAVAAGATAVYPVTDGHGWHIGRIADPAGHHWEIGRPLA